MQHLNERNVFTKTITIIQIMNEMCTWTNLVHRTNIGISPLCTSSFTGTKSGITLLIFALEQKLKVQWNGFQKTFLVSYYYTSKSEQAENSLILP